MHLPAFGLGTYRLKGQTVIDAVLTALELGYRAIDTAQLYRNEDGIGQALEESSIKRDQVFVTTKIWPDNYEQDKFIPSLRESLDKLRTDYADLVLIHWPAPGRSVQPADYLASLAEAKSLGLARHIGISNFNIALTRQAIDILGPGEIVANQIELNPYLQNRKLAAYLQEQNIDVTAYMPLSQGKILQDPVLAEIAAKHQTTVAQVALAWALQQGYAVIPSSTKRANLAGNLAAQQLRLDADDMARIATLDRNGREIDPEGLAPVWD